MGNNSVKDQATVDNKDQASTPSTYTDSNNNTHTSVSNIGQTLSIPNNAKVDYVKYYKNTDELITVTQISDHRVKWNFIIWKISNTNSYKNLKFTITNTFEFDPNHYGRLCQFLFHPQLKRFYVCLRQNKIRILPQTFGPLPPQPPAVPMNHKNNVVCIYSINDLLKKNDALNYMFTFQIPYQMDNFSFNAYNLYHINDNKDVYIEVFHEYNIKIYDINYNYTDINKNKCNTYKILTKPYIPLRSTIINKDYKNILLATRNASEWPTKTLQLWKIKNYSKKVKIWNYNILNAKFKSENLSYSFSPNFEYFVVGGNNELYDAYSTHIFHTFDGIQIQYEVWGKNKQVFGTWNHLEFSENVEETYLNYVESLNQNVAHGRKIEYMKSGVYEKINKILIDYLQSNDVATIILSMMVQNDCNVAQNSLFNNICKIGYSIARMHVYNAHIVKDRSDNKLKVVYIY